ncbi:MAG: hypothetical protein OEY20_06865 [Gemmatimonadota bacterium]|nr:hypothetical protein [Gemmatimonadota bacterium]MDH4350857.1 hypothetical protein [Gemmatimonadota bacterium]MDH5196956.1 hypothetical protein [Gemmatimonadota bacterium]
MSHRNLLAPLGLVLALVIPATLPAQTAVAAAAPQVADQAVVTGTSSSVSAREASLTFFLSDGGQRVITLRDGAVLVNGEQIATYATDGDVEREWRRLVAWTATLSPDEAVAASRDWAVEGSFDGQDQAALRAITGQFAALTPDEVVTVAHGPPEHLEEALVAAAEAREAGRIARDEIARVRDVIRVNVRDRVRDNVRIAVGPEPHVSMVTPFGGLASGLLGLGGTFAALCAIAFGASFFAGKQIDVMADTVSTSFGRSFFVGLFAQPLILPALVAVLVGLTLTVIGILLVPVAIVAFAATLAAAVVGGYLAVARVAGSGLMQRLRGHHGTHPLGLLQSIAWGLAIVLAVWLPAILLGWLPVAGDALVWLAALVTWGLATTGFGAAVLTRGGVRTTFGRRFKPPELPAATMFEHPGPEISTGEWLSSKAR